MRVCMYVCMYTLGIRFGEGRWTICIVCVRLASCDWLSDSLIRWSNWFYDVFNVVAWHSGKTSSLAVELSLSCTRPIM